jgi:dolichol-phosphate mannosyltransferase
LTLTDLEEDYQLGVFFVNDGSTDNSLEILRSLKKSSKYNVSIINLSRNFGHQAALICGYENTKSDCVISIDADLQDPPEIIKKLVSEFEKGFDIVLTKRKKRLGESIFKIFTARYFYKLISRLSSTELSEDSADFRLVSRRALHSFLKLQETEPYIRGMFAWIGYPTTIIEYDRDPRYAGKTKYSLKRMMILARDALLSFAGNPMRLPFYFGFIFIFFAMLFSGYIIYEKTFNPLESVPGYASFMVIFLVSFAIQFLILGLIGEYLFRSMSYMQARPRYIVLDME